MSMTSISSSLQVFLVIASATIATSPTSTLPLYLGENTMWSVSNDTVCLSRLNSFFMREPFNVGCKVIGESSVKVCKNWNENTQNVPEYFHPALSSHYYPRTGSIRCILTHWVPWPCCPPVKKHLRDRYPCIHRSLRTSHNLFRW